MKISVSITVNAPIEKVWEYWTQPHHITNWNFASDDWCCPSAKNIIEAGEQFSWRMESKDGSMGFDFTGTYQEVIKNKLIRYTIEDGRNVEILFSQTNNGIHLSEIFDAENIHTGEQQRAGWQAILENFKAYVEKDKG